MHTSNMIYQAATAHQTDLRSTASARSSAPGRGRGPSALARLNSLAGSHRQRATAIARATRSSVAIGRFSI